MAYRKLTADTLFDGYRFRENTVLVLNPDGTVVDLINLAEAGEGVERHNGILSPGFVNCHCHLELSHMKGRIPERTGLVDFVYKVVTERGATDEELSAAIANAESEMQAAGIVAVGDICNNLSTLHQKRLGNLRYYNFIEASGWLPSVSAERLARAEALMQAFSAVQGQQSPNHPISKSSNLSIVPHAPYSVSNQLWAALQPFFSGKTVSIHNQETVFEDEFFLQGTGDFTRMYALMKIDNTHHLPTRRSSLQSYFEKMLGADKVILVHNTFTKREDTEWVRRQLTANKPETFFCLCPNANLYIEGMLPPVEMLREMNGNIVLGTDSLASNWSLSIIDEIKTLRKNFPQILLEEMLRWATSNGAGALGMRDEMGSFEKGKRPGVVVIDEEQFSVRSLF